MASSIRSSIAAARVGATFQLSLKSPLLQSPGKKLHDPQAKVGCCHCPGRTYLLKYHNRFTVFHAASRQAEICYDPQHSWILYSICLSLPYLPLYPVHPFMMQKYFLKERISRSRVNAQIGGNSSFPVDGQRSLRRDINSISGEPAVKAISISSDNLVRDFCDADTTQQPAPVAAERGSILGAIALIVGTSVGAGILALPAETAPAVSGYSILRSVFYFDA